AVGGIVIGVAERGVHPTGNVAVADVNVRQTGDGQPVAIIGIPVGVGDGAGTASGLVDRQLASNFGSGVIGKEKAACVEARVAALLGRVARCVGLDPGGATER